jgi:hypothetical protein
MSAVKNAFSGATNFLVGGKKQDAYTKLGENMSAEEKARLDDIEKQLNEMLAQPNANADLEQMFKQHLTDFVSKDFGPNPTPEQLQQATSLIDDTFTNPAQAQLNAQRGDIESQNQALAASMGRNGNLDASTRAAIASEQMKQQLGLNAERGSRIGNLALDYNNRDYARQGEKLNTLGSGTGFLNQLTQQAMANKLSLLNARSGVGNTYQNERFQNRISGGGGTSSGILSQIKGIRNGVQGATGLNDFREDLFGFNGGGMNQGASNASFGSGSAGGGGGSLGSLGSGIQYNGANYNLGSNYGNGGNAGGIGGGGGAYSLNADYGGAKKDNSGLVSGGVGALAALWSDEKLKTNISNSSNDVDELLSHLTPYSYDYKNSKHGVGKHYSVMAQDLEKSEMGKTLVIDTAEGKQLDLTKTVLALLATNAALAKRLDRIEGVK